MVGNLYPNSRRRTVVVVEPYLFPDVVEIVAGIIGFSVFIGRDYRVASAASKVGFFLALAGDLREEGI